METPDIAQIQRAVGDRYEVVDLAGAGGMGVVYRARHSALGHFVAIKVLPPEVAESGMRQERFKREASLAAHLSHPNIVPVFEFERRAGVAFLIMPFVRGHSLDSVLAAGARLAPVELMRVLADIGAALDFVHPRGVVHRDVKPANIMIEDETGRALLTDFGVAYVSPTTSGALTAVGAAIGTPDYMAPEQAIGRRIDGRADLYALAIVAYEALTGTLPMLSSSPEAPARALHSARPEIAPRLAAALLAPLAQQPEDRPASAAEWLAQIRRASSSARRQAALLGGGVVVALAAVGAFALRRHEAALTPPSIAVMPFNVLGHGSYPVEQLPAWFGGRFSPVPEFAAVEPFERVRAMIGLQTVTPQQADSVARRLGVRYFVIPELEYQDSSATLTASLYEAGHDRPRSRQIKQGPQGSLTDIMDEVWAGFLGAQFRTNGATIPRGKDAVAAFANADLAFGRAHYDTAMMLYDSVTRLDSDFAPAYLRRVLVLAQVAPREDSLRAAMRGARGHWNDLTPSDSLLLDGYFQLLEHGDGDAALASFRAAASKSAGNIWARFALGEFYYYFGQLFDIPNPLDSAAAAFDSVRRMDSRFAAAIANSISLAHQQGKDLLAQSLIRDYLRVDSTSMVAEVIGLADTLLFHREKANRVLTSLEQHDFTVLEYIAFQAAQSGTLEDRRGPGRRVLRVLAQQAKTPYDRTLALRFGLAADLREGFLDSARARLASSTDASERDAWLVLATAARVPTLGDVSTARQRVAARQDADTSATLMWLLGATARDPARYMQALGGLARSGSPLAFSLLRDLEARRDLTGGDTARALDNWDEATRRYAVLAAPVGLVASLWPLRRDLLRYGSQRARTQADTARMIRACRSFDAIVGFVDQLVQPDMKQQCDSTWNRLHIR